MVLTSDGHEEHVYRLTGPEALTLADVARTLGEVLEVELRHVDVTDEAFREASGKAGLPPFVIDMLSVYYAAVREGRVGIVAEDVRKLTGRAPKSFADWAREHAPAFNA